MDLPVGGPSGVGVFCREYTLATHCSPIHFFYIFVLRTGADVMAVGCQRFRTSEHPGDATSKPRFYWAVCSTQRPRRSDASR